MVKINFFKGLTLFICLFIFVANSTTNEVQAQETPAANCLPITGASTPIPPNTIASPLNEGQLLFDQYTGAYRACADQATNFDDPTFILRGWTWNSNLGWISLGSFANNSPRIEFPSGTTPPGLTLTNQSRPTGNIAYSSVAQITNPANKSGELQGYWWGDNAGYIRLNCQAYYDSDRDLCQNSNFKVTFTHNAQTNTYHLQGFAWSSTVGWINLTGTTLQLTPRSLETLSLRIITDIRERTLYANDTDEITLGFQVFDNQTNITREFYHYLNNNQFQDLGFCLLFQDNRLADTTRPPAPNDTLGTMENCQQQTFTRFSLETDKFRFQKNNPATHPNFFLSGLELNIPTILLTQKIKSSVPSDLDELQIVGAQLQTYRPTRIINLPLQSPVSLKFYSPLKINLRPHSFARTPTHSQCFNPIQTNFFKLRANSPFDLAICGHILGDTSNITNARGVTVNYQETDNIDPQVISFQFLALSLQDEPVDAPLGVTIDNQNLQFLNFKTHIVSDPEAENLETELPKLSNVTLSSIATYTTDSGVTVKRPGQTLLQGAFSTDTLGGQSRVENESFVQISGLTSASNTSPTEHIFKNLHSTLSKNRKNQNCHRSDLLSNNQITPNQRPQVNNPLLRQPQQPTAVNNQFIETITNCQLSDQTATYLLHNTSRHRTIIQYDEIRTFFEGRSRAKKPPATLILYGFDLYFDTNILSNNPDLPSIVLLKNKHKVGGNTYISAQISELSGFVYSEGALFSVENYNHLRVSGSHIPIPTQNHFKFFNDLAFVGQFYSENCIGCASKSPPTKADGSLAQSVDEAKPYDFNFFRYSSQSVETAIHPLLEVEVYLDCNNQPTMQTVRNGTPPDNVICWRRPPQSLPIIPSPYLINHLRALNMTNKERKVVYFFFQDPPDNLPIFSRQK